MLNRNKQVFGSEAKLLVLAAAAGIVAVVSAATLAGANPIERPTLLGGDFSPRSEHIRTPARTGLPGVHTELDGVLRKNRDFWIRIYTQFYTHHGLIHDAKHLDVVYETLDFRHSRVPSGRLAELSKSKWRRVLLEVHKKQDRPDTMTADELKVFKMFENIQEPNKFLNAAHRKRLRFQRGQRDHFVAGLRQAGKYLPAMEEIFRREGMPVELTRLPFVESSFNIRARSKVGASGIWQFMPSTGRLFLTINDALDERNDPLRATEAAAKLLKLNYESLGGWPLAVTAYNHGRKGLMRAVRKVGSDELVDLIHGYRARSFGFASRNFYVQLLAVIELERNAEKYFGKIEREPALSYYEVQVPDYISFKELSRFMSLDIAGIQELNPGLADEVFRGKMLLPAGYQLRLPHDGKLEPEGAARVFLAGYTKIPETFKLKGQSAKKYGRRVTSEKRK